MSLPWHVAQLRLRKSTKRGIRVLCRQRQRKCEKESTDSEADEQPAIEGQQASIATLQWYWKESVFGVLTCSLRAEVRRALGPSDRPPWATQTSGSNQRQERREDTDQAGVLGEWMLTTPSCPNFSWFLIWHTEKLMMSSGEKMPNWTHRTFRFSHPRFDSNLRMRMSDIRELRTPQRSVP